MTKHKRTILIVEDEAPMALALAERLGHEGYEILQAADGATGLKMALAEHPDLILADLKLPEMDGMEMIRQIRLDNWGKSAKVIILSNISDVAKIEEAMQHGTFFYMVKGDTSMAEVLEKVEAQIGGPERD
jgi:DNA-binding response OmpR family regulator